MLLWPVLSSVRAAAIAVFVASVAAAQEFRGTWIARDGLVSRARIAAALDALVQARCNVVCVNVWSRGYTIYPSEVMARIAGVRQDPGYVGRDPLAETLFEAHKRGLEVEAWFEYGFCAGWSGYYAGPNGRGPVLQTQPTWVAMDASGNTQVSDGAGGYFTWLAAENTAVRAFLLDLAGEVVQRYDVDGVQFDRVRYPSTAFGYDPATVNAWRATHGGNPPPTNPEDTAWKRFRADGLNAFHQDLWHTVKQRRGTVRVTNAPVAWSTSYNLYLQDWPAWLRAGSVDYVYPQIYRTDLASYVALLDANLAQVRSVDRARIAPGVRAITGTPTNEVLAMVAANRARGLPGEVLWYMEGLYDDLPALAAGPYSSPAAVPGRSAGFRALPALREEDDATTQRSAAWTPWSTSAASGGSVLLAQATGEEWLQFQFTPPAAGLYTVHAHQVVLPTASAAAAHHTQHAGGEALARVDQRLASSSGWRELGVFWLAAGVPATVRLEARREQVVADATLWMVSRFASGPSLVYAAGTAGASGVPALSVSGPIAAGGHLAAQVSRAAHGAPAVVALGTVRASIPFFGGLLATLPELTLVVGTDARGEVGLPLAIPLAAGLRGGRIMLQAVIVDAGAPAGLAFTPGIETTVL